MAVQAGLYDWLWRSDEKGIKTARELITPLKNGLAILRSDPKRFKEFNPDNGWGGYEVLVRFVENYLDACMKNPDAAVRVSR
jgi:hypothetical protein